jgi:hypothetical protein
MVRKALVVIALLSSCARSNPWKIATQGVERGYQRTIVDHSAGKAQITAGPVAQVPAVLDLLYRVRPDRRFVNAAADIVEIARDKKIDTTDIAFANGAWQVRVDNSPAVTLPELATFDAAMSELTKWAAAQQAKRVTVSAAVLAAVDADVARFQPRFLFRAAQQLDTAAKGGALDAAGTARAAKIAALLASQTYDTFDLADPLRGRAVALLATAKSLDASCCIETEALIAQELGYETDANRIASALPAGYARNWVTGEDLATASTPAEQSLMLARQLRKEPLEPNRDDQTRFRGTIDIEAAPALLENRAFGNYWAFGQIVEDLMLRSFEKNAQLFSFANEEAWQPLAAENPVALTGKFESIVATESAKRASRSLDSRSVQSFYEANWYTALHQPFSNLVFHLGDADGATEFAKSMRPKTETGTEVARWMARYVAADYARGGYFEKGGPAEMPVLGGEVRYQLYTRIQDAAGATWPGHRLARDLLPTFDSRPVELWDAAQIADYPIGHLARRDLYLKSVFESAPKRFADQRAAYLSKIGARNELRKLAKDKAAAPGDRENALWYLSFKNDENLDAEWEQVFTDADYHGVCLSCFCAYVNTRNEPKFKERVARTYLKKNPHMEAIEDAYVNCVIADALDKQGRYKEAWALVEPRLGVYSGNVLSAGTTLLQRLGRNDESIKMGRALMERYPGADSAGDFAMALWRMGRNEEAAELFDPAKHALSADELDNLVSKRFVEAFTDEQTPQAVVAFDALMKVKAPSQFLSTIISTALDKRPRLSFALNEHFQTLDYKGYDRTTQVTAIARGYDALRQLKGDDAALDWYVKTIPSGKTGTEDTLISLLNEQKYDLVAALVKAHPPAERTLSIASLVVIALSYERVPLTDPRWNIVRSVMPESAPADGKTLFEAVKYVMHESDVQKVQAAVVKATDRSEAPFFIAVRATADGDYDYALGQFLAAAEGPDGYPTTTMSTMRLGEWRARLRRWDDIKREHIL